MISTLRSNLITFVTGTRYRKEIMSVLFLKAVGLFLLYIFFFAHPIDHRLTTNQLTERYLSSLS